MRALLIALVPVAVLIAAPAVQADESTATGVAGGAVTGAIVGGPVGAVVGAVVGGIAGTAAGQMPAKKEEQRCHRDRDRLICEEPHNAD